MVVDCGLALPVVVEGFLAVLAWAEGLAPGVEGMTFGAVAGF